MLRWVKGSVQTSCVFKKKKKSNIWLKHFHTSLLNYELLYARLRASILTALKNMSMKKVHCPIWGHEWMVSASAAYGLNYFTECTGFNVGIQTDLQMWLCICDPNGERYVCICVCTGVHFCWVGGLEALHVNSGGILKKSLPGPPMFQKGKLRFYRLQQVYPVWVT